MAKMAGRSRRAPHDHTIDQRSGAHARTQREEKNIATPSSRSPQYFAHQSRACVVIGTDREISRLRQFTQRASFQKIQVAGQTVDPCGGRIDHSLAADPDAHYTNRGLLSHCLNKIPEGRNCARRVLLRTRKELSVQPD
jgi:hypothetical protein